MVPLCVLVIEITFNRQYKDIQINATNLEKGNDEKKGVSVLHKYPGHCQQLQTTLFFKAHGSGEEP